MGIERMTAGIKTADRETMFRCPCSAKSTVSSSLRDVNVATRMLTLNDTGTILADTWLRVL